MNATSKTAVTILIIVLFIVVGIFLTAAGVSKTFMGLLALGLFFGIKSMWKKPEEETTKEIKLNKNSKTDIDSESEK